MIIDCHAHVASATAIPHVFFDGWARTVGSQMPRQLSEGELDLLKKRFYALNSDEHCDQLVREMDAAGIDKCVLLIIDFSHHFPKATKDLIVVYDHHRAILERHPGRFIIFAGVDPRNGEEGLALFDRGIRQFGFRGMKLYPPCGYYPCDSRLYPYYEHCEAENIPVLTHIGPTTSNMPFKYTAPEDVDEVAYRFPKVNFVLGHAGAMRFEEAALLAEYRPNVFLDISGFQTAARRGEFVQIMKFHKRKGLMRKLLFGTDWPVHRFHGSQKKWVEAVYALCRDDHISQRDLDDIFSNNFQRLYQHA